MLPAGSQSVPSIKQSGHNKANSSSFHFGSYATSTEKRLCEAIEEFKDTIFISGERLKKNKKRATLNLESSRPVDSYNFLFKLYFQL